MEKSFIPNFHKIHYQTNLVFFVIVSSFINNFSRRLIRIKESIFFEI